MIDAPFGPTFFALVLFVVVLCVLYAYHSYMQGDLEITSRGSYTWTRTDPVRFWFAQIFLFVATALGLGWARVTFTVHEQVHILFATLLCAGLLSLMQFVAWIVHGRRTPQHTQELQNLNSSFLFHKVLRIFLISALLVLYWAYIADLDIRYVYVAATVAPAFGFLTSAYSYWRKYARLGIWYEKKTKAYPLVQTILNIVALLLTAFVFLVVLGISLLLSITFVFALLALVLYGAWRNAECEYLEEQTSDAVLNMAVQIHTHLVDEYGVDLEMKLLGNDFTSLHLAFTVLEPFDDSRFGSWVGDDVRDRFGFDHVEFTRTDDEREVGGAKRAVFELRMYYKDKDDVSAT